MWHEKVSVRYCKRGIRKTFATVMRFCFRASLRKKSGFQKVPSKICTNTRDVRGVWRLLLRGRLWDLTRARAWHLPAHGPKLSRAQARRLAPSLDVPHHLGMGSSYFTISKIGVFLRRSRLPSSSKSARSFSFSPAARRQRSLCRAMSIALSRMLDRGALQKQRDSHHECRMPTDVLRVFLPTFFHFPFSIFIFINFTRNVDRPFHACSTLARCRCSATVTGVTHAYNSMLLVFFSVMFIVHFLFSPF